MLAVKVEVGNHAIVPIAAKIDNADLLAKDTVAKKLFCTAIVDFNSCSTISSEQEKGFLRTNIKVTMGKRRTL